MDKPRWRAGTAVAARSEVVFSFGRRWLALAESLGSRIEASGEPVREDAAGGVGVVDDQRQRPRPFGNVRRSGGETSSPSQLYRLGIACAFAKALLSGANSLISRSGAAPRPCGANRARRSGAHRLRRRQRFHLHAPPPQGNGGSNPPAPTPSREPRRGAKARALRIKAKNDIIDAYVVVALP